jgi:hypothetical protein
MEREDMDNLLALEKRQTMRFAVPALGANFLRRGKVAFGLCIIAEVELSLTSP